MICANPDTKHQASHFFSTKGTIFLEIKDEKETFPNRSCCAHFEESQPIFGSFQVGKKMGFFAQKTLDCRALTFTISCHFWRTHRFCLQNWPWENTFWNLSPLASQRSNDGPKIEIFRKCASAKIWAFFLDMCPSAIVGTIRSKLWCQTMNLSLQKGHMIWTDGSLVAYQKWMKPNNTKYIQNTISNNLDATEICLQHHLAVAMRVEILNNIHFTSISSWWKYWCKTLI